MQFRAVCCSECSSLAGWCIDAVDVVGAVGVCDAAGSVVDGAVSVTGCRLAQQGSQMGYCARWQCS